MKKIILSVYAIVSMSGFGFAGGDFRDVEPAVVPFVPMTEGDERGLYVGVALSAISTRDAAYSVDWGGDKTFQDRLGNISFVAGYDFNTYIAAEGRYSISFTHEDRVEMDGWSIFVKPQYPVTEDFNVYTLLGYGGVVLESVDGSSVDVDDANFQWGIGTSYLVMENLYLFADYTWLANDMDGIFFNGADQIDVDAFNIGVNYLF